MDTYAPLHWSVVENSEITESSELQNAAETLPICGRSDSRKSNEIRPIFLRTKMVSQAAGSAYIEMNNTKVIAAVYGPRHNSKTSVGERGRLTCDFKYAPFASANRRKRGQGPDERCASKWLREALAPCVMMHKYPKSIVEVFVIVLEADGGELAAATMCSSLALAEAKVEMCDLVVANQVALRDSQIMMDPTLEEHTSSDACLTLSYAPNSKEVTNIEQSGFVKQEQLQEMYKICTQGCVSLHKLVKNCLMNSAKEGKQ
eukprot:199761_1